MGHYSASKATKHSILPQIKMKTLLLVAACLGAALTAPQYGNSGGGSAPQPQRTPSSGSSIRCRTEQTTIWDTEYVETQENVCNTEYVEQCQTLYQQKCRPTTREVCQTVNEQQCTTDYKEECHDEFRTEYETYTETECNTSYKEDCQYHWEGTGYDKQWVPDRSTCKNNPYDHCEDVQKQQERQVPYPKCDQVPQEKCHVEHKKTPHRISRTVPKKVCDGGSGGRGVGVRSGNDEDNQVELVKEKRKPKSDDAE